MILVVGEVLVDIFPAYERIGGAPFNVAFHLKKLGVPVRLISRVGDDDQGHRILALLENSGFDSADIQIDSRYPTGIVRVRVDKQGVPCFDICTGAAYDHLDLGVPAALDGTDVDMVYFGSLVQRSDPARQRVQAWLDRIDELTDRFCDINLRPPHYDRGVLAGSLQRTELLKLNAEELLTIQDLLQGPADPEASIAWLMDAFAIDTVAVTRGRRGSAFYQRGVHWEVPIVKPDKMIDTVGAGDGFSAVLLAGWSRNKSWIETFRQASRFASQICGIPGAVPDDDRIYADLREWVG